MLLARNREPDASVARLVAMTGMEPGVVVRVIRLLGLEVEV